MSNYSFNFPHELRQEYEILAVHAGATTKLNDIVVRGLRVALPVLKAGQTLAEFCKCASLETLDSWTAKDDE